MTYKDNINSKLEREERYKERNNMESDIKGTKKQSSHDHWVTGKKGGETLQKSVQNILFIRLTMCYKMYLSQLGYYGDTTNVYHSCYRMGYYGDTTNVYHSCYRMGYDGKHTNMSYNKVQSNRNDDIWVIKSFINEQYLRHITGPGIQLQQLGLY